MTIWISRLRDRLADLGQAVPVAVRALASRLGSIRVASAMRLAGRPGKGGAADSGGAPASGGSAAQPMPAAPEASGAAEAPAVREASAGAVDSLTHRRGAAGLSAVLRSARLPRLALPGGLRPWVTCLSLGFVLAALLGHGRQLLQLSFDAQGWLWLLLAVGLQGLSLLVNGLAWDVILRWRGLRPRTGALLSLYVSSNLRKYIPGGIWHLAARVQALRQPGAVVHGEPPGTAQALVVTLLDPLLAAVAALALVALGGWQNGLALLCLLPLLLLHPRWLQPLLLRLERQRARQLGLSQSLEQELADGAAAARALPASYPWPPLLAELLFVLLRFAGFLCCVWAFDLQLSLDVWSWLAGFALAWTAGLVVPGAPGGLGVFEAVLLLRLSVSLPQASLLAVALSYRLVVTLADVLTAALVAGDERLALSGRSSQ